MKADKIKGYETWKEEKELKNYPKSGISYLSWLQKTHPAYFEESYQNEIFTLYEAAFAIALEKEEDVQPIPIDWAKYANKDNWKNPDKMMKKIKERTSDFSRDYWYYQMAKITDKPISNEAKFRVTNGKIGYNLANELRTLFYKNNVETKMILKYLGREDLYKGIESPWPTYYIDYYPPFSKKDR